MNVGSYREPEFEAFARSSSTGLLRSAYLLTGDRGHAEDLLQTTLLRTARRWARARRAPEAYAYRVLVNLSRDRRRGLSRRPRELAFDSAVGGPAGEAASDPSAGVIRRDTMTRAVRALPDRQREVVVMRFLLDLSVEDTATALSMSTGTVKSYTARALARLRQILVGDQVEEVSSAE